MSKNLLLVIVVGVLGILLSFAIVGTFPQPQESPTGLVTAPSEITNLEVSKVNVLSEDLISKKDSFRAAIMRTDRDAILKSMLDSSNERKKILLSLMENDTAAALSTTSLTKIRNQFPLAVQQNIEEEVTINGLLEIAHQDDFENPENNKFLHYVKAGKDKFSLHSAGEIPLGVNGINLVSSTKVRVKGIKLDKKIAIASFENIQITGEIPGSHYGSHNSGPQETLVILVYFNGTTISGAPTPTQVRDNFFGNGIINSFYKEISYNKASIVGDVVGWYKLGVGKTCNDITENAIRAADPYVNFSKYERIVIVEYPPPFDHCGYTGSAYIGKVFLDSSDGISNSSEFVSASLTWLWGDYVLDFPYVTIHELGHNFGGNHANLFQCDTATSGFVIDKCTLLRYGDGWDPLGGSSNLAHFHAYHKEIFHWLPPGNILTVNYSNNVSRTYAIKPLENSINGTQALKIPIRGKTYNYYVESRQPIGYDAAQYGNLFNGALIYIAPYFESGGDLSLVDNNRATTNMYDSALVIGQSFVDPVNNVTIKAVEFKNGSLIVEVSGSGTITTTSPATHMSDTTIGTATYVNSSRPIIAINVSKTSSLVGDKIDTITMRVKKNGSPTGKVEFGVFRSNGSAKKIFGTIDASSLTSLFLDRTFTLPNPDIYTIQAGDIIGIKFAGGNKQNFVSVIRDTNAADPFDGANTYFVRYNALTGKWTSTTSHDLYMILKQKD